MRSLGIVTLVAALALGGAAAFAQSPTASPSPTVSPSPATASPTPTVTATPTAPGGTPANSPAPPTPTATASPVPPSPTPTPTIEYNWDTTKEVVFPLIGDDGRQHYVTLMQDTAGVVRVRVSLFSFAAGTYNVVLFNNGNCSAVGDDPGQVIGTLGGMELEGATTWVLVFFNTDLISLDAGAANSIADRDGTSLAIYRPGSGGSGLRAACGRLGEPPGPPASGTGMASSDDPGWWLAGFAVSAAGGALLTAMGVRRRR